MLAQPLDPRSVHPLDLPYERISRLSYLPDSSGIYLVISGKEVVYVGQSINIRARWQGGHDKGLQIGGLPDLRVAYVRCDKSVLKESEDRFIAWFDPRLNSTPSESSRNQIRHSLYKIAIAPPSGLNVRNPQKIEELVRPLKQSRPSDEFDLFWSAVKKKVNKAQSRQMFDQTIGVDVQVMIKALQMQQEWHLKQNGHLTYLPNPDNWLRSRRWEDDPEIYNLQPRTKNAVFR